MNKIEFNKTSNIFINTGIIALYRYLVKFERKNTVANLSYQLYDDKLIVESDDILNLLEEVYYFMGKDIYDTSSKKQLDKLENVYYDVKKDEFHLFPKMKTYGLGHLITNDPVPTTRNENNWSTIKKLDKENPELALKFKAYFKKQNLKLLSKIYFNEPYKKITILNLEKKYWEEGKNTCPITGENFKTLDYGKNISPFLKGGEGLKVFNSHLTSSEIKISQKAIFLVRFSPVLGMYTYYNENKSFVSNFFNSSSLRNINALYDEEFFYDKEVMQAWKWPFIRNIKLHNFQFAKKDSEKYSINSSEDSFSPQEITFLILLTFYKKKFADELSLNNMEEIDSNDLLSLLGIETKPISLITFKADEFASTLRPNFYEEYTNVKFIIQFIHKLETNKDKRVPIGELWRGFIFITPKNEISNKDIGEKRNKKKKSQRQLRIKILDHLLKGRSILAIIESLFQKSYLLLANGDNPGFRRYDLILEFVKIYEQSINFGTIIMEESLQQRAIGLGKSIGYAILNYDNPKSENEKKANAKNGRKYLISLHKARTIEQFRETLIRIQRKYQVSIANEILESLNEKNYIAIKQYAQIGALNSLNVVLSNQKES
ncbi:hypothetical protein LB467_03570 [Salegentibacter sp. JZCK2]|uniref:hypothetical protein n=1 Tax=Salegentibacter tibetensis TaxID=2873600 RepID=UPI001CCE9C58|nr:hypothetical protein [Salegentibacter tibetensis]MBZ9728754.1 hypothetical protein [Salegentibacter tibetensis]